MPSLAQLQAEPWWGREVVSGELDRLGDRLCAHFGRPRSAAGAKGDEVHLRGAHRSQEWILNSQWCTSRSYTVQTGLSAWQLRLIGGSDFTPGSWGTLANRQLVAQITKRLIDAAQAGRLPGVVEIGGTLDGRNPTGWHVVQRRVLSFNASHLDHVHLTHDRTRLEDRAVMDNIFAIMTGDDEMPLAPEDIQAVWRYHEGTNGRNMRDNVGETWQAAQEIKAAVTELAIPRPAPVDPAAIKAALLDPQVLAAIAKAVNDDAAGRLES